MRMHFVLSHWPRCCRIVESVGPGVTEFIEGDHVLTVFIGECKTCRQCKSDKSNTCEVLGLERRGVMHSDQQTRFSTKGKPVYHYCAVSSFSEYTVVHSGCAVKISSIAPLEKICLLSCGLSAGKISSYAATSQWSETSFIYTRRMFLLFV